MTFDYWVEVSASTTPPEGAFPSSPEQAAWNLASGFVDRYAEWFIRFMCDDRQRARARNEYMGKVSSKIVSLPAGLSSLKGPDFGSVRTTWPASWFALEGEFQLLIPWYSKDDRVFHVLDNPVCKDRVFGVPLMSASSWKGLLRWACRMQAGLQEHLRDKGSSDVWGDPSWILHLFGNEKREKQVFHQGALAFYPTWFDRIGFEVINPRSRARRAGTKPIYYEVVPPGAKGTLSLLYAPWPGMKPEAKPKEVVPKLLEAIEALLTTYGISAKRTVGWGTARISKWWAFRNGKPPVESVKRGDLWYGITPWFEEGAQP